MRNQILILTLLFFGVLLIGQASAGEPGWNGTVIAKGQEKVRIKSMDMVDRPYRPLHFYGNTIRRHHYRGKAMPLPRDLYCGTRALVTRQ